MHRSRALLCVCVCVLLLAVCCRAFELQDTIHALIEENIHLHDQLENLTRALRAEAAPLPAQRRRYFEEYELKDETHGLEQLKDHTHEHDEELQHLLEEWSQHSVTPETHLLLERALCGHDLHGSAPSSSGHTPFIFITFIILAHFLL